MQNGPSRVRHLATGNQHIAGSVTLPQGIERQAHHAHLPAVGVQHAARSHVQHSAAEPVGRADLSGSDYCRYALDFGKPVAVPVMQSNARTIDYSEPPCRLIRRVSIQSTNWIWQRLILRPRAFQPKRARLISVLQSLPLMRTRMHISASRERMRSPMRSPRVCSRAARSTSVRLPPAAWSW